LTAGPSRVAVFSLLFSLFALAAPVKSSSAARLSVQTPDAAGLVAKIGERIASHPKLDSWRARADSTTFQMNSDWKPKKTTTTEKNVTVDDGRWSEEILSASETEDGKTRDITKKLQEEARDRAEKQARQTPDERKNEQQSRGRRSLDMTRDEVLPFGPDKRSGYDFTVKGATSIPTIYALHRARKYLDGRGIKGVTLIITGGLRVSSDFAKALALGADVVAIGSAALMAIGCQQYRICDSGRCPVGIATQDPGLRARLNVDESARWLANFLRVSTEELRDFARLTGNDSVHKLSVHDLATTSSEI
jgi:hypothetical protein